MEQNAQKPETEELLEISEPARDRGPLELQPGARIRLGPRRGTVDCVRGGRGKPYDARICWDGETCPVYLVFTSLEREFRAGRLEVLPPAAEGDGRQ